MNRVVKFIIKMVVTACIVVGAIFGISVLVTPKYDKDKIVNAEKSYNLVEKFEKSFSGYTEGEKTVHGIVDMMPDSPSQYFANTKTETLPASKKVNDVFIVYYQYYLSNSNFLKAENKSLQSKILREMNDLNKQVDVTIEKLNYIDNFAKRNNYSSSAYSNSDEFFKALDKWLASYQKQTELVIQVVEDLRLYVCESNYATSVDDYKYIGEVKLEICKDYAKTVYVDALKGKIKSQATLSPILTDTSFSSFRAVYIKFYGLIVDVKNPNIKNLFRDSNKEAELKVFLSYGEIENNMLYNPEFNKNSTPLTQDNFRAGFYQLADTYQENNNKKTTFFVDGTETNFIDHYYGENIAAGTAEYYHAQKQYIALCALYNYLNGTSL